MPKSPDLRVSHAQIGQIVGQAQLLYLLLEPDGVLRYANAYAHQRLGHPEGTLIGRHVAQIDTRAAPTVIAEVEAGLRDSRYILHDTSYCTADGGQFDASVILFRESGAGADAPIIAIARDISDRSRLMHEVEDEARLRHLESGLLTRLMVSPLLHAGDVPGFAFEVAEIILGTEQVTDVAIYRLDAATGEATQLYVASNRAVRFQGIDMSAIDLTRYPEYLQAVLEGEAIAATDVAVEPVFARLYENVLRPFEVKSLLVVPVTFGDQVLGSVSVTYCDAYRHWDEAEIIYFRAVAQLVAQAIVSAERLQEVATLNRLALRLEEAQSLGHVGSWEWRAGEAEVWWSKASYDICGQDPSKFKPTVKAYRELILKEDRSPYYARWNEALAGETLTFEHAYRIARGGGDVRHVVERNFIERDEHGQLVRVHGVTRDVSSDAALRAQRDFSVAHDDLTGLLNRFGVERQLTELNHAGLNHPDSNHAAAGKSLGFALVAIDIEDFSSVNESFGPEIGDRLLRAVSQRIVQTAPADAQCARLGGDVFLAILPGADRAEAEAYASETLESLSKPFQILDAELDIQAKVGIALAPTHASDTVEQLRAVDAALLEASRLRWRQRIVIYTERFVSAARQRWQMTRRLRKAISLGSLRLVYQPYFRLSDGALMGAEALLRLQDTTDTPLSPAEFIPVAESSGMIVEIGEWVLDTAVAQIDAWRAEGLAPPRVSVNISPVQIRRGAVHHTVESVLRRPNVPADALGIELTESSMMENLSGDFAVVERLRDTGVAIMIDDFGTGYSSFGYLSAMPVTAVKIDKSFIDAMLGSRGVSAILINAVVGLCHNLGMFVIAEGVEMESQRHYLNEIGCDMMQGYLGGKPVSCEEFRNAYLLPGVG